MGFSQATVECTDTGVSPPIDPSPCSCDHEGGEQETIEADQEEAIIPKSVPDVVSPSQQETKDHELTHLPYRDWCKHCVVGKATERHFKHATHVPGCVPCVHADYLFMGEKETIGTTPILVVKDDTQKSIFANVVPEKGVNEFTVQQVVGDIDLTGFTDILFKTDNEPSMTAIQEEVKKRRPHRTILENSIKGQSKSNGFIENANRFLASQVRTLRSDLQSKIGQIIDRNHVIITWLVKCASSLLNLFHIGSDGKTAYERRKGKKTHPLLVPFGEKVMYKPLPTSKSKKNALDDRFLEGVYLGISQRNGEYFIGTHDGVLGSRTIKRHPYEQRWDFDFINNIKGVPWQLQPDEENPVTI